MPSLAKSASAVGSFALVVIVGLVWWWTDLDSKAEAKHKAYLDVSDKVEILRRKSREAKQRVRDLEREKEELERDAGRIDEQLGAGDDRLVLLEESVSKLRDRGDVLRHLLAWLSYALVDAEREPELLEALGGELEGGHIVLTKLTQRADTILVTGAALEKGDVDGLLKRLSACGYLADVALEETIGKTDVASNAAYLTFELSADLRAPEVPEP